MKVNEVMRAMVIINRYVPNQGIWPLDNHGRCFVHMDKEISMTLEERKELEELGWERTDHYLIWRGKS